MAGSKNGHAKSSIEQLLEQGYAGDRSALTAIFHRFIQDRFFVPERYQDKPLSDVPNYPNDLFDLLGIRAKERVIVPIFSRPELITSWCGSTLKFRELVGAEILKIIPDDWWICLNPGAAVEREFSPWEIGELRLGPESIPGLVDEAQGEAPIKEVRIVPLAPNELSEFKAELLEYVHRTREIKTLLLARQQGVDPNADDQRRVLVGVVVETSPELDRIRRELSALCDRALIGDDRAKIMLNSATEPNQLFGLFYNIAPIYRRSFLARLFRL